MRLKEKNWTQERIRVYKEISSPHDTSVRQALTEVAAWYQNPPRDVNLALWTQNTRLFTFDKDQEEIPAVGTYLAAVEFLGFSSEAAGLGLQQSPTVILGLSCAASSWQHIFTHWKWTYTALLKVCTTHSWNSPNFTGLAKVCQVRFCLTFFSLSKHKVLGFLRTDSRVGWSWWTATLRLTRWKDQHFH